jgi:CIC family chloride channel protein
MVLHLLLGDEPLFHVPAYHLVHPIEFGVYAVLGLVGGLVSVWFVKMLLWIRGRFLLFPRRTVWLQPVVGGLIVGLLGWFIPEVLGVGYTYVGDALNGHIAWKFMALLVVFKVIATTTSYSSGNAGGIFGPSLFIGAMVGGTVGSLAHMALPQYTADVGAYALVGMGVTFAGIVRVPLTSVIMIFEMTRDYTIIVPLMISNLVSFYVSYKLQRTPIYEALAHQLGIHLPSAATRQGVAHLRVSVAMRPSGGDELTLAPHSDHGFPHVHSDHGLDVALHRMGSSGLKTLPVVSRDDVSHIEGVITLDDILRVYGLEEREPNKL